MKYLVSTVFLPANICYAQVIPVEEEKKKLLFYQGEAWGSGILSLTKI